MIPLTYLGFTNIAPIRCFNLLQLLPNPINILIYETMFLTNKIVLGLVVNQHPLMHREGWMVNE